MEKHSPPYPPAPPEPLHILLVEDDPQDALLFRNTFRRSQLECEHTECSRAEEALEFLSSEPSRFDLLVVDHRLPGMSGIDLCLQLLAEEPPCALMVLTGAGSQDVAVRALKAGVHEYIVKDPRQGYLEMLPVVLPEVVARFRERLARRQAEEALRGSEKLLRQVIDLVPHMIFAKDREGNFLLANQAVAEVYGTTVDELIGRNHQALRPEDAGLPECLPRTDR